MALGRGLGELLGEVETAYGKSSGNSNSGVNKIEVSLIKPNPNQPRKIFDEEKLQELSASIKEHGLLQPIVVVEDEDGTYTLIAGERRLRAHKLANIEEIKAIIVDKDEFKLRELALIENIQRDDLNIIELAFCYAQLLNEHNITHEELSKKVFKSRTSITNTLRLLQLSSYVQQFLATDKISAGHAKMMIGLTTEDQKKICDTIIGQKLSVRETEKLIKDLKEKDTPKPKKEKATNSYNISNLKSFAEFLKNDKIKAKIDKNS
ncbi:ParB/RepB/Spo0J family partition protein, partial [Aliarcobacter cryaerophilus]|uniref:ParB/RepB/Spo0J family partition protein n=1 Tax=Aliarcobacter cryaerophilus TaxID=28198 RepID=UPI0021B24D9E